MIWSIIYLVAVLLANYTAVWFIPLPLFGLVAVGTFIFGATFTARDYVHHLGRKYVYLMIAITALSAGGLSVFLDIPWRIIAASILAICLSESADTEIYQRLLKQNWWLRVLGSNSASIPLDTLIFNLVAFWGVFPLEMLVSIILGEIIVKFAIGGLVALWRSLNLSTAQMEMSV